MSLDIQNTLANVDEGEYLTEQGLIGRIREFVNNKTWNIDTYSRLLFDRKFEWSDLDFVDQRAFYFDDNQDVINKPLLDTLKETYPHFVGNAWKLKGDNGWNLDNGFDTDNQVLSREICALVTEDIRDTDTYYGRFYKDVFISIGTLQASEPLVCRLHVTVNNSLYTFELSQHVNKSVLLVKLLERTFWQVWQYKYKKIISKDDRRKVIEDVIRFWEVA